MNGNENSKTAWFLAAAALIVAVAWFTRPAPPVRSAAEVLGTKLFTKFTDPSAVDNLEIVQFDQAKGERTRLEVARVNGLWEIPSHGKYPADAKEHLATAANSLIGLTVTGLAPGFDAASLAKDSNRDPAAMRVAYNRFGVVDPDQDVKSSDLGVGTRVTMKDADGKDLAAAIIGKPLPDQSDQCYMRIVGKDPVYIAKFDPGAVSVRFADWIEPDLLKFKTIDFKKVDIKDYVIAPVGNRLRPVSKGEFVLTAAEGDQPWKLVQDLVFDPLKKQMVPAHLGPDEELNTSNLESLKTALEDLKIVDVERKPAAVPADLRVRKLDEATAETLQDRGFYLAQVSDDPEVPLEIFSDSGEITLQMADGVRYVLRFGRTTGESSAAAKAKKKGEAKSTADKAKDEATPGVDRYLFVTADFNQDAIPKPALEKMPEAIPAEKAPQKKAPDSKTDAKAKPADVKTEAPKKDDGKKDEPKKDAPAKTGDVKKIDPKLDGPKDAPKNDAPIKTADVKKEEPKKEEAKKEEPKKTEPTKDPAKEAQELAAKRAEVEKENKRKQDDYEAKVTAGRKHAQELSKRFAPWYYVIPGDTYSKIHLDRKDIIKKKEPPAKDAAGAGQKTDHDHDHDGAAVPPAGPAATVEKLKEEKPAAPK